MEKIEQFEQFETAAKLIIESMQYVHPETGELYSGSRVEMMMRSAASLLKTIQHYHCQKLATYIENRVTGIAYAAHECITGQKVDDWLSMIGYPPSSSLH